MTLLNMLFALDTPPPPHTCTSVANTGQLPCRAGHGTHGLWQECRNVEPHSWSMTEWIPWPARAHTHTHTHPHTLCRYAVVMLDENMGVGKMLGTECTRQIREWERDIRIPSHESSIIIGVTGNCTAKDKINGLQSGQDLFWGKPLPHHNVIFRDLAIEFERRTADKVPEHKHCLTPLRSLPGFSSIPTSPSSSSSPHTPGLENQDPGGGGGGGRRTRDMSPSG